jgi:CubicO group peptidase (beta-lactamase class C family)
VLSTHDTSAIEISEEVEASIRARVENGYNPSIIVGVMDAGGTEYFAFGETAVGNRRLPDENTIFEIGSISKAFTASLLCDAVKGGEVALDDAIQKYLPEGVTAPTRDGQSITMAQLSSHTSALARLPDNMKPADPTNPYADYTVAQMYEFLSGYELPRDIGSQYEYSNFGAGLLGHLLALRAGMSYEDLVRERIAEPLGMDDTFVTLTPETRARMAKGHSGTTPVPYWDLPTLAGAGAIRSTAHDMLIYLAANSGLEKTPLLTTLQCAHGARVEASPDMKVGLGWHIRTGAAGDTIWHNGGTGGFRSFAGFLEDGSRAVVVLTNSDIGVDDIGFHILDSSVPLEEIRAVAEVGKDVLDAHAGSYVLAPGVVIDIAREGDGLTLQLTGQPAYSLYAASETEFFLIVAPVRIVFERNENKETTALVLHQGGVEQRAPRQPAK